MPPRRATRLDAAADDGPREALHGALAEAERAMSTLLAAASAASACDADPLEETSLVRRVDALAVTLQSTRQVIVRDAMTALPLALPLPLAMQIWGLLPCDVRMRCREVCRAWRDALAEPRLWTVVKLTAAGGVVARITPALLLAVAARAGGQLERLHIAQAAELGAALTAVVAANTETLRLLRLKFGGSERATGIYDSGDALEEVLRAAPRQCVVEVNASLRYPVARTLLRTTPAPPFQALLRIRLLRIDGAGMNTGDVLALAAELAAHASLRELTLLSAPLRSFVALDAVVHAALTLRLTALKLVDCNMGVMSATALPRLLRGDALRHLTVVNSHYVVFDTHSAALLADALRSNRTLSSLVLIGIDLWRDVDAAAALFAALVGHASLTRIVLSGDFAAYEDEAAAGALLGALVAANSTRLCALDVDYNALGDIGLGPLVDALPRNTHLRELHCRCNQISDSFVHDKLIPSLAANTSLRLLSSSSFKADIFIKTRTAAMAAAARG